MSEDSKRVGSDEVSSSTKQLTGTFSTCACKLSTQASTTANKPTLAGVRLKARKGKCPRAVKAQAKHEPAVFRDQLYKHLETVPEGDFDAYSNKLIAAGATLEYLKYAEALFNILLVGGLLQPGGTYVEDGAPPSPFSVNNAAEPPKIEELKKYVEVFNKLIRRYKYLQKPLEETVLPALLQYVNKWPEGRRDKVAVTVGLLIAQGLASATCLLSLTKDHLVKEGMSLTVVTIIFHTIIAEQGMDFLAGHLKKGGIKDMMLFLPAPKRDLKHLEEHFKAASLPQVVEWYVKKQYAVVKENVTSHLKEMCDDNETDDRIIAYIKESQVESPLPEPELVHCIWQGLMTSVDWPSARPDQIEALTIKEVTRFAPIMEPFCNGPKTEVALINVIQVYCYEDTKIIKTFPQILKVLYNKDCVSDQAIVYWYQKGAKPQGKQHFLKATEPLVNYLQAQEDESEEEE
ncbi:hypothetical protein FRB98_008955 [Tulasnella sp. 332]|nr:hypothetical protein FRB98_008955 [Tulasnella sp. 332]